jgi:photosystem II stability/assembly factor-like uncharacterized protein
MRLITVIFLLLLAFFANAQCQWETLSPPSNGFINCLAKHKNKIFAGTKKGIYVSTDKGKTWSYSGLDSAYVRTIYVFNNDVYVGTSIDGLYKSTDIGKTWQRIVSLKFSTIYTIIHKDKTLFVATSESIYQSHDNGRSWQALNIKMKIWSLKLKGNTIWAVSDKDSLYKSVDNGATWEIIKIPKAFNSSTFTSVPLINIHKNNLYLKTSKGLVFMSNDDGRTWKQEPKALETFAYTSLMQDDIFLTSSDYSNNETDKRLLVSHNEGKSWQKVKGLEDVGLIKTLFYDKDILLAGSMYRGVYRSIDKGKTWQRSTEGIKDWWEYLNTFDNTISVGNFDANFITKDEGKNWEDISINPDVKENKGLSGFKFLDIYNDTLYASLYNKFYSSKTNPIKWEQYAHLNDTNSAVLHFWVNGKYTFIVRQNGFSKNATHHISRYAHNDKIWMHSSIGLDTTAKIHSLIGDSSRLYVSSDNLYSSSDWGLSWQKIIHNLPKPYGILHKQGNCFYTIAGNNLYKSDDNMQRWTLIFPNFSKEKAIYIASNDTILLLGTVDKGIFMSHDKGQTWKTLDKSLFKANIMSLNFKNKSLYALTNNGFYKIDLDCLF